MSTIDHVEMARKIEQGQPAAVARGITWCEAGGRKADELMLSLPVRSAHIVGITGSAGAGKSTLVDRLVKSHRDRDNKVGVVAVDPSSPISGGALLGDRIRFGSLAGDPGVFFRSLATRGASGGLTDAATAAIQVLSAAGFDPVIVETVGAGQAEVDIMRVADTVVVVLTPESGDEIQALKAGMMEIADIFVLNKSDRPAAASMQGHIASLVHMRPAADWAPPVISTVGLDGTGIPSLLDAIEGHKQHIRPAAGNEAQATQASVLRSVRARFDTALQDEAVAVWPLLASGEITATEAAGRLARAAGGRLGGPDGSMPPSIDPAGGR